MRVLLRFSAVLAMLASYCLASSSPVDVVHSTLTIRVFKRGLFSGFAHDHEISAPLSSGSVDAAELSVEVHFVAQKLKVLDPDASAADRAKATQVAVANALNAAADRIEKTTQVLNRTIGGGVAIG